MAQTNRDLQRVQKEPNDEFYTQMPDIANELHHYKNQLKGKRIISPCDWDGGDNCNFIHFLDQVKDDWELKSVDWSGFNPTDPLNKNQVKNFKRFQDVDYNEYDVVITNPPFSLFREFVAKLMEYPHLKFIIVCPQLSVFYKEVLKLVIARKIWFGYTHLTDLVMPNGQHCKGTKKAQLPSTCKWFTNFDVDYHHEKQKFSKSYYQNPNQYKKADNMDVLYIPKVIDIPYDYEKPMAVPLGFILKWNPEQFIIHNSSRYYVYGFTKPYDLFYEGKYTFTKLIIQNRYPVKNQEDQYV